MTMTDSVVLQHLSYKLDSSLRPVNKQVTLHDNSVVTVPVFDAKAMIMDLLTNPVLMRKENFAEGYDILQVTLKSII